MVVLFLLFIVLPLAELYVIVQFASAYGVLNTIGVLILISLIGAWLVKREGLAVLRRLAMTLDRGQIPHKELIDGFLILVAGLLLVTPGFITDAAGVLLLLPPVRIGLRSLLIRSFRKRGSIAFRVVDGMGHRIRVYDAESWETDEPPPPRGELE